MNETAGINKTNTRKIPFYLLILYFAFEYGRIHSLLGIGALRLQLITSVGILLFLIIDGMVLNQSQTKWFLGLVILMAIHVPFAANNYWALQNTITIFTYFVIYLAIAKYVVSYKMFRKLMFVWLICGIILCIQGMSHNGTVKGSNYFSDNNDFGLAMNMFLGMAYFSFLATPRKNMGMVAVIGLLIFGILATFSRGGFVGLCVMLPVILIMSRKKALGVLLVVAMVIFVSSIASPQYWDRMRTITNFDAEGVTSGRRYLWARAWDMFLDNPIIGVGPGNYPFRVAQYEPPEKLKGTSKAGKVCHSLYFTLLSELGIVGSLLFGMMLFNNFKTLRGITKQCKGNKRNKILYGGMGKKENDALSLQPPDPEILEIKKLMYYDALGIIAGFAGFLASAAFLSVLYYPHFWILTTMVASMGRLKKELEKKEFDLDMEGVDVVKEPRFGLAE